MSAQSEIKELREELRYYQTMVRVDIRALKAGICKCREIGAKMRALQNPAIEFIDRRPQPFASDGSQEELL